MDFLDDIIVAIQKSKNSWDTIATNIGINIADINKIKSNENPTKEFVVFLTKRIWREIFKFANIEDSDTSDISVTSIQFGNLVSACQKENIAGEEQEKSGKEQSFEEKSNKRNIEIDIVEEICNRTSKWEKFGRIMNFEESFISKLRVNFQTCEERNYEIMKKFSKTTAKMKVEELWKFWRSFLDQFDDGMLVISEIETIFPNLIPQGLVHLITSDKLTYIGHPFRYHDSIELDTNDTIMLKVEIGSGETFPDYQSYFRWLDTQVDYINLYSSLKEKKYLNFSDLHEKCPILNTLSEFLIKNDDNGFVYKGVHYVDHIALFKDAVFPKEYFKDTYICLLENENVVLFITKCDKGIAHALLHSRRNIHIANNLFKELQSREIIQVNMLLYNENVESKFCQNCEENSLFVETEIFTDVEKFAIWYDDFYKKTISKLKISLQLLNPKRAELSTSLKKNIITYEALENTALPTFSPVPEEQMNELKKIVLSTPTQFDVLHSPKKHIALRGSYGSGKSLVLTKKFENCVPNIPEYEVIYLICGDQQSDLIYYMKTFKLRYPNRYIIVCNTKDLISSDVRPTLSLILKHIKNIWKNRTVHIFLDEFSGSYFDRKEVYALNEILNNYSNSTIIIALQSMEETLAIDNDIEKHDLGFQYQLLQEKTSFVLFDLDYTLRCSVEINKFVKVTSEVLESALMPYCKADCFHNYKGIVDKEIGRERNLDYTDESIETKVTYNQNDELGHSVKTGPINMYYYDKNQPENPKSISYFYIAVLEYILNNKEFYDRYVICTYNEDLYNDIYYYLTHSAFTWTDKVNDFVEQKLPYVILLTDYAAVRGYEFSNFVFLLRFGTKFLKYRIIECLTRATTNLYIVTDNIDVEKESTDSDLLDAWKKVDCVELTSCTYDKSQDSIHLHQKGAMIWSKDLVSNIVLRRISRFPWNSKPEKQTAMFESTHKGDIEKAINYIVADDERIVFKDILSTHEINIQSHRQEYKHFLCPLLHFAIVNNASKIIKYLILDSKFDVNSTDNLGNLPLHYATQFGDVNAIELLVKHGALINKNNNFGETALHHAVQYNKIASIDMLLEHRAKISMKDNLGRTPLHYAARDERTEAIEIFIRHKANINIKDCSGRTPLHFATRDGKILSIEALIKHGADTNAKDKLGKTPFEVVSVTHRGKVTKAFREYFSSG